MKKIIVLSLLLVLLVGSLSAAQIGPDRYLYVYGKIGAAALSFTTEQGLGVGGSTGNRINLQSNADIEPLGAATPGAGVEIGNWLFSATNHDVNNRLYTVTYTFDPLDVPGSSVAPVIGYELIIEDFDTYNPGTPVPATQPADPSTTAGLASGATTTFTPIVGTYNTARDVKVRLTTAGKAAVAVAPANAEYTSRITLELTTL